MVLLLIEVSFFAVCILSLHMSSTDDNHEVYLKYHTLLGWQKNYCVLVDYNNLMDDDFSDVYDEKEFFD